MVARLGIFALAANITPALVPAVERSVYLSLQILTGLPVQNTQEIAASSISSSWRCAVMLRGLTELQRRQLVLADNRIALNAGWDAEMLSLELADLSAMGADLSTLGFTSRELAAALTRVETGLTDEDEVPDVAGLRFRNRGTFGNSHRIALLAATAGMEAWCGHSWLAPCRN